MITHSKSRKHASLNVPVYCKLVICVVTSVLLISCGGGDSTGSGDTVTAPDSGSNTEIPPDNTVDTSDEMPADDAQSESDFTPDSTLARLIGPVEIDRVWVCERIDDDGGVFPEVVEFGELPQFNRAWMRFVSASNRSGTTLYRVTVNDEDTLNLSVPGIDRIAPFLQSEEDSRARFFGDIEFTDPLNFTATYVERRGTGSDLRPDYTCKGSTRTQAVNGDVPTWPANSEWPGTPDLADVAGLRYTRTVQYDLEDGCADGSSVQVRFYEAFNGQLTGNRWPDVASGFDHYVIGSNSVFVPIDCAPGTDYCLSANAAPPATGFWGINPDDVDGGCDSCCFSCPLTFFDGPDPNSVFTCG